MHSIEFKQNLHNGLSEIWESPFVALRKVGFIIGQDS
jgi:hypothetical protein